MKAPITSAQAMSHPTVVDTVNALGEIADELRSKCEGHKLAMRAALEALQESIDLVENDHATDWRHGLPTRAAQLEGKRKGVDDHKAAIAALEKELGA